MPKTAPSKGWLQRTVQQQGEYLVAAEMARMGFLATTFTGNVPHFDLVVIAESGKTVNVQVKAKRAHGNWQFNLGKFATFGTKADGTKSLRKRKMEAPDTLWVLVELHDDRPADFYWFTQDEFQRMILHRHRRYLRRNEGRRAQDDESRHTAVQRKNIRGALGRWSVVKDAIG